VGLKAYPITNHVIGSSKDEELDSSLQKLGNIEMSRLEHVDVRAEERANYRRKNFILPCFRIYAEIFAKCIVVEERFNKTGERFIKEESYSIGLCLPLLA